MVLTRGEEMILTPTYHVFEFYTVHHDATLLPIDLEAGSYTWARRDPGGERLGVPGRSGQHPPHLANLDPNAPRTVSVRISGADVSGVEGRILTADAINAHNTFEEPAAVAPEAFHGALLRGGILTIDLPAKSLVVLEVFHAR